MKIEERKIRECLKNANSAIKTAYIAMQLYYRIFDKMHGTHHSDILHNIFEGEQIYTIDGIALRYHISRSTLDRGRKDYLKCFNICKSLNAVLSEAAAAIASL